LSRTTWVVVLVAAGIGVAVVIGLLGNRGGDSQADPQQSFCSSIDTLEESIHLLVTMSPANATMAGYETAVDQIEGDWEQVQDAASDLNDITMSQLDSAWDSFESAVRSVPANASLNEALDDVTPSAQSLASTAQATLNGPECS
jgi:hypothetical protein